MPRKMPVTPMMVLSVEVLLLATAMRGAEAAVTKPTLKDKVDRRARVFSAGLDPHLEATAAHWFESLGFYALRGTTSVNAGVWGGARMTSDARLSTSYCLDSTTNTSVVSDYDFVGWLPTSAVIEDLVDDYPDAKVILLESVVTEWFDTTSAFASEAAALGDACGCASGATRSTSAECGDATYHYCDVYPCVWRRAFGSETPDADVWKTHYIDRVREIKLAVPRDRLLVLPMTAASVGHATAVRTAKAIADFLDISDDSAAFAETYPFIQRDLVGTALGASARAWVLFTVIASTYILFFMNKSDPARRFVRRYLC